VHGDSHLATCSTTAEAHGLRYCMNSASLRFIPRSQLAAEGYGSTEAVREEVTIDRYREP